MAKIIRRYWWLALLQVALIASAATLLIYRTLQTPQPAVARQQEPPPPPPPPSPPTTQPLDRLTYSRVRQLRTQLALTNTDLAAIGCSQANAQEVLGALLAWYQQNQSTWNERESAVHSATSAVKETQRQIRVGPANESLSSQLTSQRQTLTSANAAWATFIQGAATSAQAKLNGEQVALWSIARSNLSKPERYRYVSGVADANAQRLLTALRKRGQGSAELTAAEQSLLSANQRTAMTTAQSNAQSHAAGVMTADASVLVAPPVNETP